MGEIPKLARRPEARAFTIEALLELVGDGRLRVPEFQRPQRWRSTHVLDLFDSVWRGFPIGDLLLSKGPAPASALHFGPLLVDAPAIGDALYVVDGQQRVTALAGALLHPERRPFGDIHAIWFDLEAERFVRLTRAEAPLHWIPVNVVGDAFAHLQWLNAWALRGERPELVQRALALGKALREYAVPGTIVDGASEAALRLIFKRINTAGVAMREEEVFEALNHSRTRSLAASCARLSELGFGEISAGDLIDAMKAVEDVDPRERSGDSERDLEVAPSAVARTERAMRRTIAFLVGVAGIPHEKLLPYRLPLRLLTRFFDRHPAPESRALQLLSRWLWRGALSQEHGDASDASVERLQAMIGEDPYASLAALLRTVPSEVGDPPSAGEPWSGRAARTRLCALAMLHRGPRDVDTGEVIDVDTIQGLFAVREDPGQVFPALRRHDDRIADHFLLSDPSQLERLTPRAQGRLFAASPAILASHGLDAHAMAALADGDVDRFVAARAAVLDPWMVRFFRERCASDDSDRPPIAAIVARVEATP